MYKTRYDGQKRTYICRKKGEWKKDDGSVEEYFEDVAFVYKVNIADHDRIACIIVNALNAAEHTLAPDGLRASVMAGRVTPQGAGNANR